MIFDKFQLIENLINIALDEDLKDGDPSSDIIFKNKKSEYNLILKEDAVISGIEVLKYVFKKVDRNLSFSNFVEDSFQKKGLIGKI